MLLLHKKNTFILLNQHIQTGVHCSIKPSISLFLLKKQNPVNKPNNFTCDSDSPNKHFLTGMNIVPALETLTSSVLPDHSA